MSHDVFATLTDVRGFLATQVLDAVPRSLRSELRAAIKLLDDIEDELDMLPELLPHECERLLALCFEGIAQSTGPDAADADSLVQRCNRLQHRSREPGATTIERISVHHELLQLSATLMVQLQHRLRACTKDDPCQPALREQLRRFYRELQAQAVSRLPWQSVFPSS